MKKQLFLLWTIPFLILYFNIVVHATSPEEVEANKTSVLQMVVMYEDDAGVEHPVQGGSGFLIGDKENGAGYIITAQEVTSVPKELEEQVVALYVDKEITKISYNVRAVIRRDVMIDVQLIAESEEMGFAIWKLSQPLYDREPLVLCDGSSIEVMGKVACVLGFPSAPSLEESLYYTMDDMIVCEGAFIGDGSEGDVKYLYHNIEPESGIIGGPILDENGDVVAINQSKRAQDGYYALQIGEVLPVLDALGIPYITTSQVEAEKQAELDAMVHKEELQSEIALAESLDSSMYMKDTYSAMEAALEEARLIYEDDEATQEDVDEAYDSLNVAIVGLEEKLPVETILLIAGSVVLILGGIIVFVYVKTKPKRELRKKQRIEEYTVTQAAPVFSEVTIQKEDYKTLVNQNSQNLTRNETSSAGRTEETYGETTVFQQEEDDVLQSSTADNFPSAYLTRKRTGERIALTEKEFVLGKEPSQTDYCITGNSSISRAHAVIIFNGLDFDIADKNATNGTFVNNIKVAAFQKVTLKNDDVIRLSDEDFVFKMD